MYKIMCWLDSLTPKLAVGIAFLYALDDKLQAIMLNTAAIWETNMANTESSN